VDCQSNVRIVGRRRFLVSTNSGIKLIELRMKNVIYFYSNVEGDEELHEDEEAARLIVGDTVERDGEHWTITKIDSQLAVSALRPLDVLRVYLVPVRT
jgi:hypothetical protein